MEDHTLTVIENKTGKRMELPVRKSTQGPAAVDITRFFGETGYFTYDPGFLSTASCHSALTYLDGEQGQLLYRGYPIEQLAERSSFLEVAYLLLYGKLPNAAELEKWESDIADHTLLNEEMKRFFDAFPRSAHPMERRFKGGTFDSLETYADVGGIRYARNKMIKFAQTTKRLTILRQQKFGHAPELDMNEMGVVVMPFVDGTSVMAKMIAGRWEFGYCRDRLHKVQSEPYITRTPHDRRLVQLSKKIQECLKFRCEIE